MSKVHDLINQERQKRGIHTVYWSREMARLAQSQANYCAKVGRLIHSNRYAFQGGENLAGGKGNLSPRTIVNIWLRSKKGHREYLLSSRVRKAGVGISKSKGKHMPLGHLVINHQLIPTARITSHTDPK